MKMTRLEEEKRLAIEWLGYGVKIDHKYRDRYVWIDTYGTYKTHHHFGCTFDEWNPQDNETSHNWWEEIWKKMDTKQWYLFLRNLGDILVDSGFPPIRNRESVWRFFLTAKPSIRWKAFIMALEILFKRIK